MKSNINCNHDVLGSYLPSYLEHKFTNSNFPLNLAVKSEKFIDAWREYKQESLGSSAFEVLKSKLVQLNFPIKKSISSSEDYKKATLKGQSLPTIVSASGIILKEPELLELSIFKGPVGEIPVLSVSNPSDFADIVRALAHKNEPVEIPATMGASLIRGINNWDRINRLKENWESGVQANSWNLEFKKNILPNKSLYQDSLIVLSKKYYSGIEHSLLNVKEKKWLSDSYNIRLFHEYSHYFTQRYYGVMSNNIYDEILADYLGISMTYGIYDSNLFLKFMGLEDYPEYRSGSRFENYINLNKVSDGEFDLLKELCHQSSLNIEKFDNFLGESLSKHERLKRLVVCSKLDLMSLASNDAVKKMISIYKNTVVSDISGNL